MTGIKLPSDDQMLEMEEVEGLVRIASKKPKRKSSSKSIVHMIRESRRWKWCAALVVVVVLFVLLFASDAEEVGALEEERGNSGMDVETKDPRTKVPIDENMISTNEDAKKKEGGTEDEKGDSPADNNGEENGQEEEKKDENPSEKDEKEPENDIEDNSQQEENKDENPSDSAPDNGDKEGDNTEEKSQQDETKDEDSTTEPDKDEKEQDGAPAGDGDDSEKPANDETPTENKEEKSDPSPEKKETPDESDSDDYFAEYPNRDIPLDKFPDDAWQKDPKAVQKYLERASTVVDTAITAILQEYGKPTDKVDDMFALDFLDFKAGDPPGLGANSHTGVAPNGGWTTRRSFDGLIRRLLHAMITKDTFTFVLGGHSAAAGHGNHFVQSYTMQFHAVMEPVFERLGIKLTSRNLAQGGLGTVQSAMAAGSIYGDEMDMIVWDSGMTEGRIVQHIDLYMRQAILGGNRVPILWGGDANIFKMLHENADADIGQFGSGMVGIPETTDETQALTIPYAARYLKCTEERQDLCKENKFHANCWVERPDVTPPTQQQEHPPSQVGWHPGFRTHQLSGRVLAMTVLQALKEAIEKWKAVGDGKLLPDNEWHVTDYYENIRSKIRSLDPSLGSCYDINGTLPTRMCNTPMKGRTEFTPRAEPEQTSIAGMLKPAADGWIPRVEGELLYEGPDVDNPFLHVPEGEVDVVKIINSTRRRRQLGETVRNAPFDATQLSDSVVLESGRGKPTLLSERKLDETIVVGKGWEIDDEPPGRCGGEYNDICGRTADNACLLNGHHDRRGGVLGNGYSGWLFMDIPAVKEGIIVLKMETWHFPEESTRTVGWTSPNNEGESTRRRLRARDSSEEGRQQDNRLLKRQAPELTDDFMFDFAINGKITSYNKDEFKEHNMPVQRVVECLTVLDDPNFTNGEEQTVEVAIRLRGCGNTNTFKLTHVYWA